MRAQTNATPRRRAVCLCLTMFDYGATFINTTKNHTPKPHAAPASRGNRSALLRVRFGTGSERGQGQPWRVQFCDRFGRAKPSRRQFGQVRPIRFGNAADGSPVPRPIRGRGRVRTGATANGSERGTGAPKIKTPRPNYGTRRNGENIPPYFFAGFFAAFAVDFFGAGFAAFADFFAVAGFTVADFFAAVGFFTFIFGFPLFVSPPSPSPHGNAAGGKSLNKLQTKYFGMPFAFADTHTDLGTMPFSKQYLSNTSETAAFAPSKTLIMSILQSLISRRRAPFLLRNARAVYGFAVRRRTGQRGNRHRARLCRCGFSALQMPQQGGAFRFRQFVSKGAN